MFETQQTVTLERIFERCVQRNFNSGENQLKQNIVNVQFYAQIWSTFLKWTRGQLEQDRTVQIKDFGIISLHYFPEIKEKLVVLSFNESLLMQHKLSCQNKYSDFSFPNIKINYQSLGKSLGIDSNQTQFQLTQIFQEVLYIISSFCNSQSSSTQQLNVDLGLLGKIKIADRQLKYTPQEASKSNQQSFASKYTVKGLMDSSFVKNGGQVNQQQQLPKIMNNQQLNDQKMFKLNDSSLVTKQNVLDLSQAAEPKKYYFYKNPATAGGSDKKSARPNSIERSQNVSSIKQKPVVGQQKILPDDIMNQSFSPDNKEQIIAQQLIGNVRSINHSFLANSPRGGSLEKPERITKSPIRKFVKPDNSFVCSEMLGAGTDPLAREGDFSKLAGNAGSLIKAHFVKPNQMRIRFPPVLDKFSRTIGAPISGMKFNFSPSMRIGANITPSGKNLYIDHEQKCVRVLKKMDNTVVFSANPEYLQRPATQEEELLYLVYRVSNLELEQKVRAKRTCYERYNYYIEHEISRDYVAPIRQYWINDVLDLIPGQYPDLAKDDIEHSIDKMLVEVGDFYYTAIRKAILDYVLKNDEDQVRLGIMEVFHPLKDYGDNIYLGLEPDNGWKTAVISAREEMYSRLVTCNDATLEILDRWHSEFKPQLHLLELPPIGGKTYQINEFAKIHQDKMLEVRRIVTEDWRNSLVEIYKKIQMENNEAQQQLNLFYESTAILLSNLLRNFVTETIYTYGGFYNRFDKGENQRTPEMVIKAEAESLIRCPFDDAFLKVKLISENNKITFEDKPSQIKNMLLKIAEDIVMLTHEVSRPENSLVKRERLRHLQEVSLSDEFYEQISNQMKEVIDENLRNMELILSVYNKYSYLLNEKEQLLRFINSEPKREEYTKMIKKYEDIYNDVKNNVPFFVRLNMVVVDGTEMKKELLQQCEELVAILVDSIHSYIQKKNTEIDKTKDQLMEEISQNVENTQKLVMLENKIEKIQRRDQPQLVSEHRELCQWLGYIQLTPKKLCEELMKNVKNVFNTTQQIMAMADKVDYEENRIKEEREEVEEDLKKKKEIFATDIVKFQAEIDTLKEYGSRFMAKDVNEKIRGYNERLDAMLKERTKINEDEELLGWGQQEFPKLTDAQNNLKPFEDLWSLAENFDTHHALWTKDTSVFKLNPEQIEKDIKIMFQTAMKLNFLFNPSNQQLVAPVAASTNQQQAGSTADKKRKQIMGPPKLIAELLEDIREFQQNVPLVRCLCNPGLKARHWEEITKHVGFPLSSEKDMPLNRLVQMEVGQHLAKLDEISDSASKEFAIEKILNKMLEDWQSVCVELKTWKDTGTFIVSGSTIDEMQQLLDDQIVKTQTMKGSSFAKIFEERISQWEEWLQYTLNFSEIWVRVQSVWIYLEPIFSSPDILKRLPYEGGKFREVDSNWREVMNIINQATQVLKFTTKDRTLLKILRECQANLEIVQRGLNAYLEGKRASFPRFYFLSNDELLEILSETKDPLRVQPHLKKCFEGIAKLQFDDKKSVLGMYSSENEYVEYLTHVDTAAAHGNVDEWLLQTEGSMLEAVHDVVEKAHEDYTKTKRDQWVLARCGQAVLCMSMTFWTFETERAIEKGCSASAKGGIVEHLALLNRGIEDLVSLVRREISVLDRCTIEALIVLDVHNKDVVAALVERRVEKVSDFDWQSQLRYYWENNDTLVRIINAVCQYNYEYLGNSTRLVITPLTDRCYRTLCGAVHLNYGGAPEGPAGTGKTETVKDLAKALARQCVVFNCSDGLDYKAMGKFFKGLASAGAWSCFDEFNRIDLEVLSVVAQQILTIQLARTRGAEKFLFEECEIPLKPTCNVFITMNPGYAGRSELPDNLKALFRAVAMMVPDYAMIAEIVLLSFGFSDARNLARKIVSTYKLCSEQLSSQDHYDYGMRAVKSVLTAAGNLKRRYINENESVLMLRAICDVNLAKFLAYDIPLFKGITSDLFPGVQLPVIDYSAMQKGIADTCQELKLQVLPYFEEKIIQIYEMVLVRHGLMVVGMPFAGKTSAIRVLAGALGKMFERGQQMGENRVQITVVNPKSIPMKQLYGCFDDVSHEWTDGVLAVKFRVFAKDESPERKWLMFDGPIDAVWIENMNTVLDDNKKLCLMSGEIIAMSKPMNLIFEPMDLAAASPATVSRCGMIYMEPASMGWQCLFESWKQTQLPQTFKEEDVAEIDWLFQLMVDAGLTFVRSSRVAEISPTQDQNLVQNLMRLFRIQLNELDNADFYSSFPEFKHRLAYIDNKFIFAYAWSIGGSLTTDSRKTFDIFLKKLTNGDLPSIPQELKKKKISLPERGMIFDYAIESRKTISGPKPVPTAEWVPWLDSTAVYTPPVQPSGESSGQSQTAATAVVAVASSTIPAKSQVHEILVPTSDTVRYTYLLRNNVVQPVIPGNTMQTNIMFPTLFCGPTGTGKSTYIKSVLNNQLDPSKYLSIEIGFSAQSSSTQTQEIVDMKLDRRRKGVFGPKLGKGVIFVDDLNMPQKEKWGAQPPIEILRQLLDQGGWYDNKDKEKPFRNIVDTVLVAAMGPPGGGRTFITPRLLRHFSLISLANFDDETLNRIFGTILEWYLKTKNFSADLIKFAPKVISGTLDVYKTAMAELLPTPMKSHYLFNLRDFAKVIFGVCMSERDKVITVDQLVRLWAHETWRVFGDRLVSDDDRVFLLELLRKVVSRAFALNFDNIFAGLDKEDTNGRKDGKINTIDEIRQLVWSDVMTPVGAPKRYYEEVTDFQRLQAAVDQALSNYNMMTDKPMELVLFNFAVEHLLIIARILKSAGGNALLVGVGGSGRQSLTRLASHLMDFTVIQIEISKTYGKIEWQEDIKRIMKSAGGKGQQTVFLFTDSQIKQEFFVEDINNLLNTAEVPNLFPPEEKAEIMELVRNSARSENKAREGTPAQLYSYFLERVKQNLHIVLCFSPIGDQFRARIRMFPSLVNCCTIDWFSEWPADGLQSVARRFLANVEMDEPAVREACVSALTFFHSSTAIWAKNFYIQLRRKYYVTPTSYIDMITSFQLLLADKRARVLADQRKYDNGYQKIITTEKTIEEMQINLIALQPQLKAAAEATELKRVEVEEQKVQADVLKEAISKEEAIVQSAVDEANAIKSECEKDLAEAMPALMAAEEALKVLKKEDIDFLKTMKNPSLVIKLVMQTLCLVLYPNPTEKRKNQETLKMEVDWWAASLKLLNNSHLLEDLLHYDRENMEDTMIQRLGKFITDPENTKSLELKTVENASTACKCIMQWINGVYNFYFVNKKVKPKKLSLKAAEEKVNGLNAKLAEKQKELKKAVDKVDNLNRELRQTTENKQRLEEQYNDCSIQLDRAKKLIESLGGEKGRWGELGRELRAAYTRLTGDVLTSAALIAYLGAFTAAFRAQITDQWAQHCCELRIPSSQQLQQEQQPAQSQEAQKEQQQQQPMGFSLQRVLGDPVKIRAWFIDGLPSDTFSVENAIIVFKARRWPLCIDPQGQANKWIKRMEGPGGSASSSTSDKSRLAVIKLTDSDFLRTLENAIQFGNSVLLENVGEELDPTLTPILLKQTFKKGSTVYIKLGDQTIEYSASFRFYITTKLRNPHYLPEVSTKVTLLNFMITYEGLNDQLLGILVKKERPELEEERERLIIDSADNKKQLFEIEEKILQVLSGKKNILTDEEAIKVLTASKEKSNEINEKQAIAEITEQNINTARLEYKEVSQEAACLFFAVSDLVSIDPMYQYSLTYYIDLFSQAISKSERSDSLITRLDNLKSFFLYSLYANICRSLFEKDKLLLSFLLCTRLREFKHLLHPDHLRFLLTGGLALDEKLPPKPGDDKIPDENPKKEVQESQNANSAATSSTAPTSTNWLSNKAWGEMCRLSKLPDFDGIDEIVRKHYNEFKKMYDSPEPHRIDLPREVRQRFSSFHRLCILRTVRPDKMIPAIMEYIVETLGKKFIEPPPFDLAKIYLDSSSLTPLIFILSPGSDPFASLNSFAELKKKSITAISLGQGQGPAAQKVITEGQKTGNWVVLQNCHLAVSWMPTLEKITEEFSPDPNITHQEFRLWLTSYPSDKFPTSILQAGVKMTTEAPKGLKQNLVGSFLTDPISRPEFFEGCLQPKAFKKLLFSLCFFHAVIQERRKYGPLGWNIAYEFNESDLRISVRQLQMFLNESAPNAEDAASVPFAALKYLTSECNYGGRVTDDKDRRLINTLLNDYYNQDVLGTELYKFAPDPLYRLPDCEGHDEFIDFIKGLPINTSPEVFGFHPNADITKDINETNLLLNSLLLCSNEGGTTAAGSTEDLLAKLIATIMGDFPECFNTDEAIKSFPVLYKESMNTVLTQELTRFNGLISIIRSSLRDINLALQGKILLSPQLERASRSLYDGKTPDIWMEKSYPSLKPLASYVSDLKLRLKFFQNWLDTGTPSRFWISGFYFTQSFLTGVLQNYARKTTIPIDEIIFDFEVTEKQGEVDKPEDGAYIWGLFLEGSRWNFKSMEMDESEPKVLFESCPQLLLKPSHYKQISNYPHYNCPVYKTSARRGVLSTTGHSTNFVMWIRLPSKRPEKHWIKRGVALLTQLDD